MSAGLGIPVKLLHESLGHIVTVELKTGNLYRGKLAEGARRSGTDFLCRS
jgi:small nuclear ribonucleoprotein D3